MLLLFALSYALHTNQIENIKSIQESYKKIDKTFFEEDTLNRRMILRKDVQFGLNSSVINPKDYYSLRMAGQSLLDSIRTFQVRDADSDFARKVDLKYLLIIEGMASSDRYYRNYELSYERALQVYRFWTSQGIVFDESTVEVLIAGSGTGGVGRSPIYRDNQRIIIQLMAKYDISKINE
jgi:outer membrane protein OmpA-like peptidoglycan-associated protein